MIVDKDNSSRTIRNSHSKYFTRMHKRTIQDTSRDDSWRPINSLMLHIQTNDPKSFRRFHISIRFHKFIYRFRRPKKCARLISIRSRDTHFLYEPHSRDLANLWHFQYSEKVM